MDNTLFIGFCPFTVFPLLPLLVPPGAASQKKHLHLNPGLRVPFRGNSTLKRLYTLKLYFEDFISPPELGQLCLQCGVTNILLLSSF